MSASMTVFFVERTGHLLGAVTRNSGVAPASRKGPISEDLLFRFKDGTQATVSGNHLSTLLVAPLPEVPLAPLDFHAPKATDAPPGTAPRPKDVKRLPAAPVSVTLYSDGILVDLGRFATKNENVWILVAGGTLAEPLFVEGTIEKDSQGTTLLTPALAKGVFYQVLALVEDHATFLDRLDAHGPSPIED